MQEDAAKTAVRDFILHWGSMGAAWGVNRTVAQIHALLYLSPEPLTAERISDELAVARSNVSNSLRELRSWGLIRPVPVLGDRRDHFESVGDVWEMFRLVLDERKRREFDPTLEVLRTSVGKMETTGTDADFSRQRLEQMLEFFEVTTRLHAQVAQLSTPALRRLMKMGNAVRKLVEPKGSG